MTPQEGFAETLKCEDVVKILEGKQFWTEYEPVVDVKSGKIFGYEALARFVHQGRNLPPAPVFELAHHDATLFFELEKTLKMVQIAHRPKGGLLFINIDPHNFIGAQKNDFWIDMLLSIKSVCVEVTENTDGLNASLLAEMLPRLKQTGAYIAQDDIGNDAKPFCFELTNQAHILKFDRTWFSKIEACSDYSHILKGFIAFAKLQRKKTVLEGVETPKIWLWQKNWVLILCRGFCSNRSIFVLVLRVINSVWNL